MFQSDVRLMRALNSLKEQTYLASASQFSENEWQLLNIVAATFSKLIILSKANALSENGENAYSHRFLWSTSYAFTSRDKNDTIWSTWTSDVNESFS